MSVLALEAVASRPAAGRPMGRAVVDAYLEAAMGVLEREGFRISIDRDMRKWAAFLATAPRNAGVNPSFDPDRTGPHDDAFWIAVWSADAIVAVAASRLVHCERYYDFVRTGLLWSRRPGRPVDILVTDPGFPGPMSHSGGLWVHPSFRGCGLSWVVPRMNQAISQLLWPIDDVASVIFQAVHDKGLPATYGAHRCRRLIDGYFWPTGRNELIFSAEYPGPHLVERADRDLDLMQNHRNKQMRDLAAMARQWNGEATVARAAAV